MSSTLKSDVRCLSRVSPSGESYGGNREPGESTGSLLPGIWRDSLHVTCRLTALRRDQHRAWRSVTSMGEPLPLVSWKHLQLHQSEDWWMLWANKWLIDWLTKGWLSCCRAYWYEKLLFFFIASQWQHQHSLLLPTASWYGWVCVPLIISHFSTPQSEACHNATWSLCIHIVL